MVNTKAGIEHNQLLILISLDMRIQTKSAGEEVTLVLRMTGLQKTVVFITS